MGYRYPYKYKVKDYNATVRFQFDRELLKSQNLFPIQAVMFSREVYEDLGGLDESLDVLEDWNLWVKYSTKYNYHCTEKTTSVYRTPCKKNINKTKQRELDNAYKHVRKIHEEYVFQELTKEEEIDR